MHIYQALITGVLVLSTTSALAGPHEACEKAHVRHASWQASASHTERFEKHHAELHDALTLNAAQETAWTSYQTQVTPVHNDEAIDAQALRKLNTLQRLDKLDAWDKTRATQHGQRNQAIRRFYAQLNDAQKQIFDAMAFPQHLRHGH